MDTAMTIALALSVVALAVHAVVQNVLHARQVAFLLSDMERIRYESAKTVVEERKRAELLWKSKDVGEFIQAQRVSLVPDAVQVVQRRTVVPLDDEELAKMEKNGAFARGGAAVETGFGG